MLVELIITSCRSFEVLISKMKVIFFYLFLDVVISMLLNSQNCYISSAVATCSAFATNGHAQSLQLVGKIQETLSLDPNVE